MPRYDVVIIGGAVHGASAAYHLASHPGFTGSILLAEKDPSFQQAASALSAASIRQQFSSPVNIQMSLFGIEFLRGIGDTLEVDGDRPFISLVEGGYLFLATEAGVPTLTENHALQSELGADIAFFNPSEIAERFPYLALDDIVAGAWGATGEGWFDGYGLMQAFRKKARALGVEAASRTAVEIIADRGRATGVRFADGEIVEAGTVIVAAGTGARALIEPLGSPLPVEARKRCIFTFACKDKLPAFPMLIDPTGVYCRPEGELFLCGSAPEESNDPLATDFDVDYSLFEEMIWPILASRVPAFEAIRQARAWAGHYDMNLFDHNAIVGRVPGFDNLLIANGFSGHGLQQSPAVGRGLSELVVDGEYRTLDLSPLGYERILENRPLIEKNIV
ncbi:FAD-binding oxidoreductase [Kaistia dalseonensis]|uniref:Glycine/D-amino acid oxidase-like deaminating enzyme n=1 Tax=Kaistia dalseonensis TaxID=410840 RepID=A0ABU0HDI7_9HYPH|nr:FAD-binding oxidoreductase [Kaistia dalseonensis]MCX5497749.1 FAD-binding oxidoreductase [Kaistia dalseonensis]MDQ0440393.1 glycine/D-amino acid oxidase-like deaminating enzyme [Kaistia dalseonensis]